MVILQELYDQYPRRDCRMMIYMKPSDNWAYYLRLPSPTGRPLRLLLCKHSQGWELLYGATSRMRRKISITQEISNMANMAKPIT